jgi:hypothetical protein
MSAPYSRRGADRADLGFDADPGWSGDPDHFTGELQVLLQWEGGAVEHDAGVAGGNALHNLLEGRTMVQVNAGHDVAAADNRGNQRDHVLASGVGRLDRVDAVYDRCLQLLGDVGDGQHCFQVADIEVGHGIATFDGSLDHHSVRYEWHWWSVLLCQ